MITEPKSVQYNEQTKSVHTSAHTNNNYSLDISKHFLIKVTYMPPHKVDLGRKSWERIAYLFPTEKSSCNLPRPSFAFLE